VYQSVSKPTRFPLALAVDGAIPYTFHTLACHGIMEAQTSERMDTTDSHDEWAVKSDSGLSTTLSHHLSAQFIATGYGRSVQKLVFCARSAARVLLR